MERWNAKVPQNATVFHLGDYAKLSESEGRRVRYRLNGSICMIRGNHSRTENGIKDCWEWIRDYHELEVPDSRATKKEQFIVLSHYAFRVWNRCHHGAWNLYGHSHGSLPDDPNSRAFDVGVDCHGLAPISYEEVYAIMKRKTFKSIDHHGAE